MRVMTAEWTPETPVRMPETEARSHG
jgi:hypothetical protein